MNGLHGAVHLLFFICTTAWEVAGTGAAVRPVGPGDTVVLPCDLQLGYKVMWFVQRDETVFLGLLASKSQAETVNFNYASDSCFSPPLNSSTGSIDLRIRNVSRTDLGLFYCTGKAQGGLLSELEPGSSVRISGRCDDDDHRQARSPFELEKSCFIILLLVPPLSVLIMSGCVFGLFRRTGAEMYISPEKRKRCKRNVQEVDHFDKSDFITVRYASGQDSPSKVCLCVCVFPELSSVTPGPACPPPDSRRGSGCYSHDPHPGICTVFSEYLLERLWNSTFWERDRRHTGSQTDQRDNEHQQGHVV